MRAAPRSGPKMLSAVSGASPREPSAGPVQHPDTPGWHSGSSWDRQCSLSPHDGSPPWPTVRRMWITTSRWQPHLNTLRLSLSGTSCGSLSNPSCLLLSAPLWWDSNRLLKKKIMLTLMLFKCALTRIFFFSLLLEQPSWISKYPYCSGIWSTLWHDTCENTLQVMSKRSEAPHWNYSACMVFR